MSRVLGGTRGLAVGRVCKDSAHRAGSTCPVAAWDTRPALRVFEGQSHLIFKGSLGIHKQMHAYFYFPVCLNKWQNLTRSRVIFHWIIMRDCYISVQLPHFLFVATKYSAAWISAIIPLWLCFSPLLFQVMLHVSLGYARVSLGYTPTSGIAGSKVRYLWNIDRYFQTPLPWEGAHWEWSQGSWQRPGMACRPSRCQDRDCHRILGPFVTCASSAMQRRLGNA